MSYGHAEKNLAAIDRLTRDTVQLLRSLPDLSSAQQQWLTLVTDAERYGADATQLASMPAAS
jgi:hypothetical protein